MDGAGGEQDDRMIRIWLRRRCFAATLQQSNDAVMALEFSGDGRRLVAGRRVQGDVWNLESGSGRPVRHEQRAGGRGRGGGNGSARWTSFRPRARAA
jgi:hypothetical protein